MLGDFNADLTPHTVTNSTVEEINNIFSAHHLFPLISNPTLKR